MEEESVGYTYYVGDKALYIENSDTGSYYDTVPSDIFSKSFKPQPMPTVLKVVYQLIVKY